MLSRTTPRVRFARPKRPRAERFHYYDTHPTREDLMGESVAQDQLLLLLFDLLRAQFRDQPVFLARNLNIYTRRQARQYPVAPDLSVFLDVPFAPAALRRLRSWRLYEVGRRPPELVVEIASDETWQTDLYEKPAKYEALGVREYLFADADEPEPMSGERLRLWRRQGEALERVTPDVAGRLWSEVLTSWVTLDGHALRLYTAADALRLTEAQTERRLARSERARARAERQRAETER